MKGRGRIAWIDRWREWVDGKPVNRGYEVYLTDNPAGPRSHRKILARTLQLEGALAIRTEYDAGGLRRARALRRAAR